jgi:hypothetical protein
LAKFFELWRVCPIDDLDRLNAKRRDFGADHDRFIDNYRWREDTLQSHDRNVRNRDCVHLRPDGQQ